MLPCIEICFFVYSGSFMELGDVIYDNPSISPFTMSMRSA